MIEFVWILFGVWCVNFFYVFFKTAKIYVACSRCDVRLEGADDTES